MPALIAKTLAWLLLLSFCWLGPTAGAWWPMAWGVLAVYGLVVLAAFGLVDHELLKERAHPAAGSDPVDKWYALAGTLLLYPATLLVAGFDHAADWSAPIPFWLQLLGLKWFAVGYTLVLWAMATNRFFTSVVRMQGERGHHVVDRGPYAWVRHPGYAGTSIAHLALPLALGSWWALIPAICGCWLFIPRLFAEERRLLAHLQGYREYRQAVNKHLIPQIW